MPVTKHLILLFGVGWLAVMSLQAEPHAGPLCDEFDLTLAPGHRHEWLGPFFYSEQKEDQKTWAVPLLAHTEDPTIQYEEFDFAYPLLTYDRFGTEYRIQLFQLFSFAGGEDQQTNQAKRFTIFPLYFQQRSPDVSQNYTALMPFYGTLKDRLFRDQIDFILFPCYVKTRKRDLVTVSTPYPFFSRMRGDGLRGWQSLPLMGHEHKEVTQRTNDWGELETVPGHDTRFVLWPFFTQAITETGTPQASWQQNLIPFYSITRSQQRDSTSYLWPFGVTHTFNRETNQNYTEWDAPWPLVEFARGDKHTDRVFPLFSHARTKHLESDFYLWPLYKYNRTQLPPLDEEKTHILFFLMTATREANTETGQARRRVDFWPWFTFQRDFNGNQRLQILSIIEPVLPANHKIERDYSQLYSLWRAEKNPTTGAASQSLLWNLWRHETRPGVKKISLLFGLFQYESSPAGSRMRICYIPAGTRTNAVTPPAAPR